MDNKPNQGNQRIGRLHYIGREILISVTGWLVYLAIDNVQNGFYDFLGLGMLLVLLGLHIDTTAKRLHDMGYGNIFLILLAAFSNIGVVVLAIVSGQNKINQYGPPPSQIGGEQLK